MSALIDEAEMKAHPGGYLTGTYEQLKEDQVLSAVRMRRRQLGQMTVALDVEGAKRRIPDGQYQISRKIDGEFTCLIYRKGEVCTLNPGGTLRAGAPFMAEAAAALKKAKIKTALIGGELYVQRPDGARPRVHDVVRVARKPESAAEVDQLAFAAFNIYELDGKDLSLNYGEAFNKLLELFEGGERIHPVETVVGENAAAVLRQFKRWVIQDGAEGVVARSPTAGVFKVKPRHSLDLAVVGFSEGLDDREGLMHDLLLAVVRPSGRFQLVGRVGGGFSDEQRAKLLETFRKSVVESDFHEVNSERVAYQMIAPGPVVEIECLDLISRTSRGNTIDKMVLEWNAKDKRWEGVRRLPVCSILSPRFVRLRDDKSPGPEDTGLKQITDVVEIPDIERVAVGETLPRAEILQRAVASKVLREKTMVRKIMAIKTNKEDATDDFPAYVLHVTDFSPNRRDQLQFETKITASREQLDALFAAARTEFFKQGWKEAT